ncbi:phage tail protein [Marinobacterium arenosum]|uniref:phage tail protein n=1 Tax=Marinobacterium arenosum TaxID=2862496 RepID=UPI001C9500A4|nr:tail fiber protein [Marinobacterium arenosum]MBY4678828.1 tail fiber protein [Marinobacterium arenosum]
MDFFMGGMIMFGGNFSPRNWSYCKGQTIQISDFQALFAIMGTTWGGDGRTTFCLPDMRSRVPVGLGQGPGLTNIFQGAIYGLETVQLGIPHMPPHSHDAIFTGTGGGSGDGGGMTATATAVMKVNSSTGKYSDPVNRYLAEIPDAGLNPIHAYSHSPGSSTTLAEDAIEVDVQLHGSGGGGITGGTVTVNNTGSGVPFPIIQPSIGMNYIIAMDGIFPSRN